METDTATTSMSCSYKKQRCAKNTQKPYEKTKTSCMRTRTSNIGDTGCVRAVYKHCKQFVGRKQSVSAARVSEGFGGENARKGTNFGRRPEALSRWPW